MFKFQDQNGKKSAELHNGAIRDYKSGQVLGITNWGERDYK